MKIKNGAELARSPQRKAAIDIFEAGLAAIDTDTAIRRRVKIEKDTLYIDTRVFPLGGVKSISVVGVGKCSLAAAAALEDVLGDRLTDGRVIDIQTGHLRKIKAFQGTHPLPSDANADATADIVQFLEGRTKDDLVIFIISGGGSTLLCQPTNFTCEDEGILVDELFKAGATINELNTLRKHLSKARGGGLAKAAYPAQVVSLIFSDVPGNSLQFIASGPTVMDETTIVDARAIITKYNLRPVCGSICDNLVETPKDHAYFERVENILFISNEVALSAMADKAKALGFSATVVTSALSGEAQNVGEEIMTNLHAAGPRTALLYGGETTVTIRGKGKGGRNQEVALAALEHIRAGELVLSAGSDGHDNTDVAGALCDTITKESAERAGLDAAQFLRDNDSYEFFERVHDHIITGETGSNVSDLIITLHE